MWKGEGQSGKSQQASQKHAVVTRKRMGKEEKREGEGEEKEKKEEEEEEEELTSVEEGQHQAGCREEPWRV